MPTILARSETEIVGNARSPRSGRDPEAGIKRRLRCANESMMHIGRSRWRSPGSPTGPSRLSSTSNTRDGRPPRRQSAIYSLLCDPANWLPMDYLRANGSLTQLRRLYGPLLRSSLNRRCSRGTWCFRLRAGLLLSHRGWALRRPDCYAPRCRRPKSGNCGQRPPLKSPHQFVGAFYCTIKFRLFLPA
jgi:hypothetical protein